MAARVAGVFDEKLTEAIANSKILVVGAGGIGCEILKNLVLTGFPQMEIVSFSPYFMSPCMLFFPHIKTVLKARLNHAWKIFIEEGSCKN